MSAAITLRDRLYDYIRMADEKKLHAIYSLLEDEMNTTARWWEDKKILAEMDKRYHALESGTDKGITIASMEESVSKLRRRKYGR